MKSSSKISAAIRPQAVAPLKRMLLLMPHAIIASITVKGAAMVTLDYFGLLLCALGEYENIFYDMGYSFLLRKCR